MAEGYTCYCCSDTFEGEPYINALYDGRFAKDPSGGVHVESAITRAVCEMCGDDSDNVLYCNIIEDYFLVSEWGYSWVDALDGYAIDSALEVKGYRLDNGDWQLEEQQMADKPYVDFYWQLEAGQRVGVLMVEDGGEVPMGAGLAKKIYDRIDAAGADRGDPHTVNVYTRLQLIEDKILKPDYTL